MSRDWFLAIFSSEPVYKTDLTDPIRKRINDLMPNWGIHMCTYVAFSREPLSSNYTACDYVNTILCEST